ncbi:helix-turn-helix domain-containing protein [Paenibacillus senegalensis]|uniref:helix-turn-helix domain-containing protein n=1 Tax=Paenibacillus senegalensis TaxID=1465766 RepID=UPI0002890A72|nr:AraC family transcriptional regulator [Paenibacillus senegalensis]
MIIQVSTPHLELWQIEGEFSNQPHFHENEFQITIPIVGECQFTLGSRHYTLEDGGGIVQHPKERHFFEIGSQSGVFILKVNQHSIKELIGKDDVEFAVLQKFDPRLLRDKFRSWTNALLACSKADRIAQDELESQVLFYLLRALAGNHQNRFHSSWRIPELCLDPHMATVLEYIRENFRNEIQIDELAATALQSRYHFIRSFKAMIGVTPYQYVLQLRMEEAKRLLKRSAQSVTEIGFSVGFSSVSQFQRAFVKMVGMTPTQYRNLSS